MRNWLILLFALGCFGAWRHYQSSAIRHSPGTLVAVAPKQSGAANSASITYKNFTLTPLQDFSLSARVLSRADYGLDRGAELAPIDLALGWGRMSDSAVLAELDIRQTGRFYLWSARKLPIPQGEITASSSNMHMIPADAGVARQMRETRVGDIVEFSGSLVEARASDGYIWRSSLSRTDTGNGACELVYVQSFSIKR